MTNEKREKEVNDFDKLSVLIYFVCKIKKLAKLKNGLADVAVRLFFANYGALLRTLGKIWCCLLSPCNQKHKN